MPPEAPPPFLAAILSPVLWRLERPDRFDSYAAGVSLLQLSFPGLRSDDAERLLDHAAEQGEAVLPEGAHLPGQAGVADGTVEAGAPRAEREALKRLYRGEYGQCESCARGISRPRLEAVPEARLCIQCKEKEERRARMMRE